MVESGSVPCYPSIAAYLEATGRTQESLAEELGISNPQMSRIVRGLLMPKPKLAIRISEITGVAIEAMVRAVANAGSEPDDAAEVV